MPPEATQVLRQDGSILVPVPAGEFDMGTSEAEAEEIVRRFHWRPYRLQSEAPRHTVYLDSFYISKYPVTVAQYARFVKETGAAPPTCSNDTRFNKADQPVVGVSRSDAMAYAEWAGLRLPTEAEWEKAARGNDGRQWPWGDAWDRDRLNSAESSGPRHPTPVDAFDSVGNLSPYGASDMAGNVWEWCLDRAADEYYGNSPRDNPCCTKPETHYDGYYVVRGGSWYDGGERSRCTARYDRPGSFTLRHLGFRCARSSEPDA